MNVYHTYFLLLKFIDVLGLNEVDINETVNDVEDFVRDSAKRVTNGIRDGINDVGDFVNTNISANGDVIDANLDNANDIIDQEVKDNVADISSKEININITVEDIINLVVENQEILLVVRIKFNVIEDYEYPQGKFTNLFGNVMVIDSKYVVETMSESLQKNVLDIENGYLFGAAINELIGDTQNASDFDINEYAFEINGVLKDRQYYYLGNPEENNDKLLEVQNNLNLQLKVDATTPVALAIKSFYLIGLFLESIFATIVFFMVMLAVMLIHSLMICDVDEKTYEMGMLRALGLRKVSLMQLVVIQSSFYSLPGVTLGLVISALINVFSRHLTFTYTVSYTTYMIAPVAAILGVIIGLLMPLASNVWAIKRALGKKIRDSLDIFHTGISDVLVKIVKLENFGISTFEAILGLTLVWIGVMTYYLAPAAFIFNRLGIFFIILNIILLGMIVGLAFLCFLIFPTIQTLIVYAVCNIFRFDLKLKPLIMKNMNHSHKKRNAKTSMLFTISLAYLVFGGSSLLLLGNLIIGIVKSSLGADISITSIFSENGLPEQDLRQFIINDMNKESSGINNYSFRGQSFNEYWEDVLGKGYSTYAVSGGYFPDNKVSIYPVESRFLHASLTEFYIPKYGQSGVNFPDIDGKEDYVWSLYSNEGTNDFGGDLDKNDVISQNRTGTSESTSTNPDPTKQISVILPEGIKDVLSINGGDTIKLSIYNGASNDGNYIQGYRFLVRGLPQKMPGFSFTSYKQVQFSLQGLVSFDSINDIIQLLAQEDRGISRKVADYANDPITGNYTYGYPKNRLVIDVKSGYPEEDREILV